MLYRLIKPCLRQIWICVYIICHKNMALEFQYLKLIFNSQKGKVDIWKTIVLQLKSSVYSLKRKCYINLDIYINQVLQMLELLFYNQSTKKKGSIIWIDKGVGYYTSKIIAMYYHYIRLIYINWLGQYQYLYFIKSLWRIIKLYISI